MTKKLQTVFIPKHRVSYECDSSFVNLDEVVSVFDRVEFKITGDVYKRQTIHSL